MAIKYIEYGLITPTNHEYIIEIDSIDQLEEKILNALNLETSSGKLVYNEEKINGSCYWIMNTPLGNMTCRFGELQIIK